MASPPGRSAALDVWQRQAVLAAAALLRERYGVVPEDVRVKNVLDMLIEVVDPPRRAVRLQREMASSASRAAVAMKSERRGRGRRAVDRRVTDVGSPTGVERRTSRDRRKSSDRRVRR